MKIRHWLFWMLGIVLMAYGGQQASAAQPTLVRLPGVDQVVAKSPLVFRGQVGGALATLDEPVSFDLVASGVGPVQDGGGCGCGKGHGGKGACGGGCLGGVFENMSVLLAGDAWKNKADDDDNNNFGFRAGFNTAFGLGDRLIRGQIGGSMGAYDFFGREDGNEGKTESQAFLTFGFYQRSDVCCGRRLSWAIVWDQMAANGWGEEGDSDINLSQVRFLMGYALNESNEIGVWGTAHTNHDVAAFLGGASGPGGNTTVEGMDQLNLFWHRNWEMGADTSIYAGYADTPGNIVVGFSGHSPLSGRVALFGNVHYIIPDTHPGDVMPNGVENSYSEETWNVSFGIVLYSRGKSTSRTVSGLAGLPLLPVADNGSFAVSAPVGNL